MRSKFKWILTLTLAFLMQFSYAQEKTITGTVTESGQPLPGATVLVKGTTRGTQTDFDGKYSIKASVGETLEFSYIGMATKSVAVGASSVINMVMEEDVAMLAEVVLISEGYRTTTKARSSSAVSVVSAETLENRPNPSVLQTMQGQVAGFNITTGSGQPGAISETIIRGVGTLSGNTEPLYVIDGVPQSGSSFRAINPEDIETFNVLKDAAAVAQYGNRGSNGVVVVTTRRGKSKEFSEVVVTSTTGVATLQNNYYNKMNSRELLTLERTKGTSGLGSFLSPEEIAAWGPSTDWKDVLLREALTRTVNVSITGGGEKLRSFTSFNYNETEGLSNMSNFNRFTFRNNLDGKAMNDKLTYGTSVSIAFVRDNRVPALGTGGVNQNPMLGALIGLPYLSPSDYTTGADLNRQVRNQNPDSPFTNRVPLLGYSPLLLMDLERNRTFRFNEFQIFASNKLRYDVTKDISVNNTFGVDYTQFTSTQSVHPEGFNAIYFAQNDGKPFGGSETQLYEHDVQINNTFSINFNKEFGKHTVDFGLYTESLWATRKAFNYTVNGLNPLNYYPGSGQGGAYIPEDPNNFAWYRRNVASSINKAALLSYFALADYDYDSKFGFSASLRRDGSYRFRGNNTFGNFWSLGTRVNLDKMSFMEGSKFDMLKLRFSYGTSGNQNIAGQSIYTLPNYFRDQYVLGGGYLAQQGFFPVLGNPDVKWETTIAANFGVDIIYNSRLRSNIDVYRKRSSDMFLNILTSSIIGQQNIAGNFGEITNKGIEVSINYDLIKPAEPDGFKLNIWANGSFNDNEVTNLPADSPRNADGDANTIIALGAQVNEYYLFQHAGINPTTGNHLFVTADGNLTETPNEADRVQTGLSRIPRYQGGFGFNLDFKNFYLTTQFTFIADVQRFDGDLMALSDPNSIGQFNVSRDLTRHWTTTNTITDQPSLFVANQGFAESSTRFLVDASYIRVRNVQLGYNFPKKLFNESVGVRLFVTGENLYTWTKWRGWDPESPRTNDFYQFPQPRYYTVGAQVNF